MERIKDPTATLDYGVDWTPFLDATDGDTITTATWINPHPDLTVEDQGVTNGIHVALVSGGESGRVYTITSRVETEQGRVQPETLTLVVRRT